MTTKLDEARQEFIDFIFHNVPLDAMKMVEIADAADIYAKKRAQAADEEKDARIAELEAALKLALRRRCNNLKCGSCEYLHDEQPEEYELKAARAALKGGPDDEG